MSTTESPLRDEVLLELNFLRSIGTKIFLYPFIERSKPQIVGYAVTYLLVVCTTIQLFITIFSSNSLDWLEMINVVPNLGVCAMTVIKYTKLQTHKVLYNDVYLHFQDEMWDIILPHSDIHRKIVFKYKRVAMFINRFLLYYSIPLIIIVDSFPYIVMKYEEKYHDLKEYLYPFDGWYPFDKIRFYGPAYVWESYMTVVVVCVYVYSNMLHASWIAFTCMELRILGNCLEELLSPKEVSDIKSGINVDEIHLRATRKLKFIISRHEFLAKKCAALDAVLGDAMLLNYSLGAVFICLTAFTSTIVTNLYKRVRYFFMCLSLLVEVFNQCFMGQIISDHSENVTNSIYTSNWLHASPEAKKVMFMFMVRTQKPFELTGKGYIIMNMNTFSRICSTSYQFFNLLRTIYD